MFDCIVSILQILMTWPTFYGQVHCMWAEAACNRTQFLTPRCLRCIASSPKILQQGRLCPNQSLMKLHADDWLLAVLELWHHNSPFLRVWKPILPNMAKAICTGHRIYFLVSDAIGSDRQHTHESIACRLLRDPRTIVPATTPELCVNRKQPMRALSVGWSHMHKA